MIIFQFKFAGRALAVVNLLISASHALTITNNSVGIIDKAFSYVVVGGGTAGLTVASRLAEVPGLSILVIEAGTDEQNSTLVNDPGEEINVAPVFSWNYTTVPQPVGGKIQTITQGKLLGGSSSINGLQWTRGTKDQYDAFEKLGNAGWNFQTMLKYMMKSEQFHLPSPQQIEEGATAVPSVHGFLGPVNAGYPQPYTATTSLQAFISSALSRVPSLAFNPDVCTGEPNGAVTFFYSLKPGNSSAPGGNRRSSSAVSYIYPFINSGKTNLTILTGHQATSIIWDKSNPESSLSRAIGVNFVPTPSINATLPPPLSVKVMNDVIVSSGTLGSPHFLELSGIGDKAVLGKVAVPVEVDLPAVGTNLQDQPLTETLWSLAPGIDPTAVDPIHQPLAGSGIFANITQILGAEAGKKAAQGLLNSVSARAKDIVAAGGFTSVAGLEKVLSYQANSIANLNAPVTEIVFLPDGADGVLGGVLWSLLPQVRGTVHITSNNPSVRSAVNPLYLDISLDLDLQSNATKLLRSIFSTSPLRQFWTEELVPGLAAVPENASDAEWQSFIVNSYSPVLHPIGSVPMLPKEDGGAVDGNLLVYGTDNVRVIGQFPHFFLITYGGSQGIDTFIDASVIPIQLSAHLSATVYGIAEKGADIIKASLHR